VNILGEGNGAEDSVDSEDGDAVVAVDNKPNDIDAPHYAGKLVEPLLKRRSAAMTCSWGTRKRHPDEEEGRRRHYAAP
jgi:hypothetical protein